MIPSVHKSRKSHLAGKSQEIDLVVPNDRTGDRERVKAFEVEEWADIGSYCESHLSEGEIEAREKITPFEVEEW